MDKLTLASYIDATIVQNNNTLDDVRALAFAATEYRFKTVITLPCYTGYIKELLCGSDIHIGTVSGFPWGGETGKVKAFEAKSGISDGADEIDMVINLGYLFSGDYDLVLDDIKQVRDATRGKILKCIIESAMLTDDQIKAATDIVAESGADFVKCCTGFNGPALLHHVEIMRNTARDRIRVKASGGIRTAKDAEAFINAGAERLGIGFKSAVKIIDSI